MKTQIERGPKVSQFEWVLKSLDHWGQLARDWQGGRGTLQEKLEVCRLQNAIREARRLLRVQYYVFEDMCKAQHPKPQEPAGA